MVGKHSSGKEFPVEVSIITMEETEVFVLYAFVHDISEKVQERVRVAQSQKLESIGQLAAGIAHEINTPTQFVGDNTRFCQDSFGDIENILQAYKRLLDRCQNLDSMTDLVSEVNAKIEELDLDYLIEEIPRSIQQSLDGIERVTTIVRSMKEFSHPGERSQTLLDLNRAIESTITVARNEWTYVSEMVTHLDPSLPSVLCYPSDFNQVILSIIVNAAHAIEESNKDGQIGTITITTAVVNDKVEVRIADSGCGMPPEIQSKIFDPFFTTKQVGKGTGQGLALAYNCIVKRLGGELNVDSNVDQGTTFIIRLSIGATEPVSDNNQT